MKRDELLRYGLGIVDVQNAIAATTLNVPAGKIIDDEIEYTVRVMGEVESVDELRETFLTIQEQGPQGETKKILLTDIAEVVDANAERDTSSRLDGDDAVIMVVQKTKEGNAVEISKELRESVDGAPPLLDPDWRAVRD